MRISLNSLPLRPRTSRLAAAGALVVVSTFGLAACSAPESPSITKHSATESTASEHAGAALEQAWAKSGAGDMSAAFGTLVNHGETPLTLVGAETTAASSVELHEMAMVDGAMVMRKLSGDFDIPAGGSRELAPGGEHLMLMGLTAPLLPGDEITVTLQFSDGTTLDVVVPVRDTAGADEEYAPGEHDDHATEH
ncbi:MULTISPECIES: copper chaperone PCu(A)C [unclassified Leucobacter]|uniref:copper chaperone PCu(A)C n=1 Tax=unclassified Leucobacter TaxID=2621730 RepID=UPI00165D7350|nr:MULTISPECIES: copper chaperone PCu(A)C [unclassified Leucobacter]MBC9925939.1 copper chaperone PCu(A)C [Leucobacter sp. cx-169]